MNLNSHPVVSGEITFTDAIEIMCLDTYKDISSSMFLLDDQLRRHPGHLYANILMLKFYSICGLYECVLEQYMLLNVKNIQVCSLSYLIINDVMRLGGWDLGLLELYGRIVIAQKDEAASMIISCLKDDNSPQLDKFLQFLSNLDNVIDNIAIKVNFVSSWMITHDEIIDLPILIDPLTAIDKRDFKLLRKVCPNEHNITDQIQHSFQNIVQLMQLRIDIFRSIKDLSPIKHLKYVHSEEFCIHGPCSTGARTIYDLKLSYLFESHLNLPETENDCIERLNLIVKYISNFDYDRSTDCFIETLSSIIEFTSYCATLMKSRSLRVGGKLKKSWISFLKALNTLCQKRLTVDRFRVDKEVFPERHKILLDKMNDCYKNTLLKFLTIIQRKLTIIQSL